MKKILLVALFVFLSNPFSEAHAKGSSGSSRYQHRFGVTVGLMSDPFPNIVGVAARLNLTDFLQIHAGYGHFSYTSVDLTTGMITSVTSKAFGGGARLFVPGWAFSPYAGFNYTKWDATGSLTLSGKSIDAGTGLPAVMYVNFGFDWQTHSGFNIGAGAAYILAPTALSDALKIVPQAYLGWYF